MITLPDLSKFQATGRETCFHGRHIGAQIYAGLDGKNWRLKDYEARGGYKALAHLCSRLGVEEGGTSDDGLFTVQKAECLGACADAPVLLVNDRKMLSFMSEARLDELLATLAAAAPR